MHGNEKKHEKGQSLVEFALSLPILILILSGLIDIGRVYFAYIFLEEAAAEAALYVSIHPDCIQQGSLPGDCDNPNNALWRARNSGSTQGIVQRDTIQVAVVDEFGNPADVLPNIGEIVRVRATLVFPFTTPGMSALMESINGDGTSTLTLTVNATHMVITE